MDNSAEREMDVLDIAVATSSYPTFWRFLEFMKVSPPNWQAVHSLGKGDRRYIAVACEYFAFERKLPKDVRHLVRTLIARLLKKYPRSSCGAIHEQFQGLARKLDPHLLDGHIDTITTYSRSRFVASKRGADQKALDRLAREILRYFDRLRLLQPSLDPAVMARWCIRQNICSPSPN